MFNVFRLSFKVSHITSYHIMFKYIILLLILFLILFVYCHVVKLQELNNHLDIIQVSDPDPELIIELLDSHQPIIMQRELYFWKTANKLIGKSLPEINQIITTIDQSSPGQLLESIKMNLDPFNLPLSYDWNIDIRNVVLDDKSGIFFIQQSNYMQCFGCLTGQFRIILAPNDQKHIVEPFVNNVSSKNAEEILNKEPMEMNFIEVIIRQGNLIYIPWGWLYFIYKSSPNTSNTSNTSNTNNSGDSGDTGECIIVDCINTSIIP